jgi:LacI family transcriptional regulator
MMALGCISVLADAGLGIPDDVGVAGFDDIPLAHYATPPLTTMKVHIADIGERAMTGLLSQMRGSSEPPALQILLPELVVRASTIRSTRVEPRQQIFADPKGS